MEDHILLKKIYNGNENAFQALLDRYEHRVFRYFYRCFQDRHIAEDLSQTVFMQILQQISRYRNWTHFTRYLFKMCKNITLQAKRNQRKSPVFSDCIDLEIKKSDSLIAIEQKESTALISDAIYKLPFMEQQAILLKFMEGFSIKDIANILDLPINTVKSHIHRGKIKLRKYLAELGEAT